MVFSIPRQVWGQLWPFSSSPGIHTCLSTAWFCDQPIKSLSLENLHFLTDVTTITTAISTAKYRAEFWEFPEFHGNCWHCWICDNQSVEHVLGSSKYPTELFFPPIWGDFFFSPFFESCFCNIEPYFLPLLKETQRFFRPSPQAQTSPRLLLVLIFFRSPFQHGSQAQARSRELKGKGHQGSQKCSHTLSRGTWGKGEQNHWAQRRLKSAAHTHTDTKEGGKKEKRKKKKTKNVRKMIFRCFFFFFRLFCCLASFVFKAQLWVWSITSCCVLNKVTLCAVWIREGGAERQQLAALLIQ